MFQFRKHYSLFIYLYVEIYWKIGFFLSPHFNQFFSLFPIKLKGLQELQKWFLLLTQEKQSFALMYLRAFGAIGYLLILCPT